jgi:hypothetical protein
MSTYDYTNRDYSSIKSDLLARAESVLPEWTSRDQSDFGMLIVDLWAYMGDILHYYVDRAAQESFLESATQRESLLAMANLLDYVPTGRRASHASISLTALNSGATDETPILIPKYTRFLATPLLETADDVVFTSDKAIAFNLTGTAIPGYETYSKSSNVTLNLTEGEIFEESFTSDGKVNQQYTLVSTGVVASSIEVTVAEGANGAVITYTQVPRLIEGTNTDLVYTVSLGADDTSTVIFGNSVHGKIPTTNAEVTITYRRSRGSAGNVTVNAIKEFESLNNPYGPTYDGVDITPNEIKAVGGTDSESIASLKSNIPASFRSQDRAVSLNDYSDLTLRVPGVIKTTSVVTNDTAVSYGIEHANANLDTVVLTLSTVPSAIYMGDVFRVEGLGYPFDGSFTAVSMSDVYIEYALDVSIAPPIDIDTDSNIAKVKNGNVQIFALSDQSVYDGTLDVSPTETPLAIESTLRTAIYDYIAPRQMVGINTVVSPYVNLDYVYITIDANAMSTYPQEVVKADIEKKIKDLFSFNNVYFDQLISLGNLYRLILEVYGVDYVTINQFTTSGDPDTIDTVGISPAVKGVKTTVETNLLLLKELVVNVSGGIVTA